MECKFCCEYCKEQEIKRMKEDIKEDIKLLKSNLKLGFFELSVFDATNMAERRAKIMYEKVKKLNKLNNELED
jgi:hypothetical protein